MRNLRWVALAALSALPALAGSQIKGGGRKLAWPGGKLTLRISRTVHLPNGDTGVDRRESAASVHTAVAQAVRAWTGAGRAAIEVDLGFTDAQTVNAGENLVTFTDPAPFDAGLCNKETYVSCTLVSFTEEGAIAGATVAFNPYKRHSSIGLDGTYDIGVLMMHEMGHVLGLDHSIVTGSVMVAEAEQEAGPGAPRLFPVRALSEDDLSTLAAAYPLGPPLSGVSGKVERNGAPIAGARVIAFDSLGRVPHGIVTEEDGVFRLPLPPGDYVVVADPKDGPGAILPGQLKIAAGEWVAGATIPAPAGPRLTVENVGVVLNGSYAGMPRVDLARGRDHSLALTRTPSGMAVELILPEPAVSRSGNPSIPSSAPQLVRQPVRVAAEAPTGSYGFALRAGMLFTLLPAPMRIVPNPRIDALEDAGTGEAVTVLRPGRRYRIKGADLSAETVEAGAPPFDGALAPTQLAGVAVKAGDRWAPLVSVAPGEIVFEAPAIEKPGEAQLAVAVGSLMESPALNVTLALE